ncbi:MAG: 3-deoxy-7-phosphoheptulonate synthase [Corallococcus sp.]|nr:3-deoxy-7-phosphoheptulonate synthase [Corallococcus sp.]
MYKVTVLPCAEEIKKICPMPKDVETRKKVWDSELAANMRLKKRFVVVCGPCSADDPKAVNLYCRQLSYLQNLHPDLFLVARIYTTKPHSNGQGYRGLCFGDGKDIAGGIVQCRKMMINAMELGLPVADELLYPELYDYFSDLVSYWFLGARSSEDSLHRGFASLTDACCGVKNPTNGLIDGAVQNLQAVANPCVFPFRGRQLETGGNPLAHVVLRGGTDKNGYFQNLDKSSVAYAKKLLKELNLNNFVMTDLSHANSGKMADKQIENAQTVACDKNVDGVMVESYVYGGADDSAFGTSRTDACVGLEDTAVILSILSNGFQNRK